MRAPPTCHLLQYDNGGRPAIQSEGSSTSASSNTLSSMDFTHRILRGSAPMISARPRRQAGCMAKAEKAKAQTAKTGIAKAEKPRRKIRLPKQVEHAISAAEDKK